MEVEDRVAILLAEQPLQGVADLGELGEEQQALALGHHLLDHLGDPLQLVRAGLEEGAAVLEELGRVIADLLEPRQGGEHQPLALDAVGRLQLALHVVHHGLVERGLLRGEVAVDLLLHLLRQVLDDALVALQAAQDEGLHQALEGGGTGLVLFALDGRLEALLEGGGAAQVAGVQEVEQGPEVEQAILDGGAGEGQAVGGLELAAPPWSGRRGGS